MLSGSLPLLFILVSALVAIPAGAHWNVTALDELSVPTGADWNTSSGQLCVPSNAQWNGVSGQVCVSATSLDFASAAGLDIASASGLASTAGLASAPEPDFVLLALDEASFQADSLCGAASSSPFRPTQLIAPTALIGTGIVVHCFAHESLDGRLNSTFQSWSNGRRAGIDDYLQYIPGIAYVGLTFTGVPCKEGFVDRMAEGFVAYIAYAAITRTMKGLINSPRPNGRDNKSFPSGHTGTAFVGAELVRMNYGWGWGAGAYVIAVSVATMRMYNEAHWLSDVLMGAGIGILCAHIGEWLLQPVKNLFGIPESDWGSGHKKSMDVGFAPTVDPVTGSLCACLALKF